MMKSMIGIAMLATSASSAALPNSTETISRIVSIADLDLTNPEHRAMVRKRITRAARTLCHRDDDYGSLALDLEAERCRKEAIASAQPQLDRAVTLAFARKQGPDRLALASQ